MDSRAPKRLKGFGGVSIALALFCLMGNPAPPPVQTANLRDVVINEVAWMGTVASSYDEWIELYNNTDHDIDLTNWTLVSLTDNTPNFTFTAAKCKNLVIPAKGFFLLERTDDTTISDITTDCIYTGELVNSGEALSLQDATGTVVDTANGDGGKWPAGTAAEGTPRYATMERLDPLAPDSDGNWVTNDGIDRNGHDAKGNPVNGTPKAPNSPFNKPPSCKDIDVTTDEDTPMDIDLARECTDPDRDPLAGSFLSDPAHGTARFLSPVIRYTPDRDFSGQDSFAFRVSDGRLESTTATVNITVKEVNDKPIAGFTYSPAEPTDLDSIQFSDRSHDVEGEVVSWSWAFGDGGSSTERNPTHKYADDGTYTVCLTVKDEEGAASDPACEEIGVRNVPPAVGFGFLPQAPDTCTEVQFSDESEDPDGAIVFWNWTFGDGAGSSEQNPEHRYLDPGAYTVALTGTDDDGASATASKGLEVSLEEGDVDNDCAWTVKDAILAAKAALGLLTLTKHQEKAADVVPPCGAIDVRDVVRIAEVALEIKDERIFTCSRGSGQGLRRAIALNTHRSKTTQLRIGSKEILPGERTIIKISASAALTGLQVGPQGALSFDPEVIQVWAIRGVLPFQVLASEIDNEVGRAKFMAITLEGPRSGEVIEIEVEAIGQPGESTLIKLTLDMALDAQGEEARAGPARGRLTVGKAVPLEVRRVLSIPNPVRSRDSTRFAVEGQGVKEIQVRVYDLSGREVFASSWVRGATFEWDLLNRRGEAVANGIYLYTISVRGFGKGEFFRSGLKKLVVLK